MEISEKKTEEKRSGEPPRTETPSHGGPTYVDEDRVRGLKEVGRNLGMSAADVASLLEQYGLYATETALAEGSRAGDKILFPAAFVKRRAAFLAKAQANEAENYAKRQKAIDRESRERLAESASARIAAESDMNAVNEEIAAIPAETLERLKATTLADMGNVPRSVSRKRGFDHAPAWKIAVVKMRRQELTNVASFG